MSEIIIYEPAEGGQVTVRLEGESLWLTQEQMAELFGRERSVITKESSKNKLNIYPGRSHIFMENPYKNVQVIFSKRLSTSGMSSGKKSLRKVQYVQILHVLLGTESKPG